MPQFRIQREACEAAGHHIPMVVENVRGAQKWVGRASWNYGSYYLWGDVPALMPLTKVKAKVPGLNWKLGQHIAVKAFNSTAVAQMSDREESGRKLPGNNSARMWSERRVQRLSDAPMEGDAFYLASSGSKSRKAASALIAKIPFPLAQHIAQTYYPKENQ